MKRVHYEVRGPNQHNAGVLCDTLEDAKVVADALRKLQPDTRIVKVTAEDVPLKRFGGER